MGKDTMAASSIPSHAQTAKFDLKKNPNYCLLYYHKNAHKEKKGNKKKKE